MKPPSGRIAQWSTAAHTRVLNIAGQHDVQPAEPRQQQQLAERDLVNLTMEQFAVVARSRAHDVVLDLSLQV